MSRGNGESGVEKWLSKHEEAEARWSLAMERLTDSKISDGTLITLPQPQVSQTKTGLSAAIRTAEAGIIEFDDPEGKKISVTNWIWPEQSDGYPSTH